MSGRCIDCGFLSYRAVPYGTSRFRTHSGYFEVEDVVRKAPNVGESFVPGDGNAVQRGEFGCLRAAADITKEIAEAMTAEGQSNPAAQQVLNRDRQCQSWTQYCPGMNLQNHYLEMNARALEKDRRTFYATIKKIEEKQAKEFQKQNKRLGWIAFWITLVIGVIQIVAAIAGMAPESVGYRPFCDWLPSICAQARSINITGV